MPFYDIECAFERIEAYFQSEELSKNKTNGFCDHLKFLRKQCNPQQTEGDLAFLIYCIDTILEMMKTDAPKKIAEFANISRQAAQVYQKKRFFHSLSLDIKNFRLKWGKEYFENYKELYRKSVKTDPRFMTREEEEQYVKKTKASMLPYIISLLFIYAVYHFAVIKNAPNEWYMASGFVGLMFLHSGIFNFFVDKQIAMSKKTAWILVILGGIAFLLSMIFLFT